jgi:hypothetical protein
MDQLTSNKYSVDNLKHAATLIGEWLLIYFTPGITMVAAVLAMITLDLWSGVSASKKEGTYSGSKGLRASIPKFNGYVVGILAANILQNLWFPNFPVVQLVAGFIIWVEVRSINENIERGTGVNIMKLIGTKISQIFSYRK